MLESLRNTDTVGGFALEDRANWSIDLDLPIAQPGQPVDIYFGQAIGYDCATKKLCNWLSFEKAGVNVAVVGEKELDTGDGSKSG